MRERMVTRTVKVSDVTCMMVNVDTKEVFEKVVRLPGKFKTLEAAKKAVEKAYENMPSIKPIEVTNIHTEIILYGMSEQDFVNAAEVLPPRKKAE